MAVGQLYRTEESIGDVVEFVELLYQAILSTPTETGKNGGEIQGAGGERSLQLFGRVLTANSGVRACERVEALGRVSASPFQSVRNTKLRQLFQ